MTTSKESLAQLIDHTNLKPWATTSEIDNLCQEALEFGFKTVCVYGYWVPFIKENYPNLTIAQVLNFPNGLSASHVNTLAQIETDADEYDIVMNLSKLRERKKEELIEELKTVKSYLGKKVLKVIIETAILTQDDLFTAIDIVSASGADFIKTSTGTVVQTEDKLFEQVLQIAAYIRLHQLPLEIKASGGIKTLEQVKILIGSGATRIGSSNSVQIINRLGH